MLDLECNYLILQMFQCFFNSKEHHPNNVKTNMLNILSLVVRECDVICKQLQYKLLAIWRKEQIVSLISYELAERLVAQNMRLFKRQLAKEELMRMKGQICPFDHLGSVSKRKDAKAQTCNMNELKRINLCFSCKGPWDPNNSCSGKMVKMIGVEQEGIPFDDSDEMGSSNIVVSMSPLIFMRHP